MKFEDIPKFPRAYWNTDVDFNYLPRLLESWDERNAGSPLILNPEWQRGHVWTKKQKIAFVEYSLKGGTTGKNIYFNCSSWGGGYNTPIYCVDGLQRLSAAIDFIDNKIPAFGTLYKDYEDNIRLTDARFSFHMLKIKSKKDLLSIYINFNSGGTPHKPKEIARIQAMMDETPDNETL